MLAPMQGLTNRGFRQVFGETAKPDVLFTEFVRVGVKKDALVSAVDLVEATTAVDGIPLVVQVIGSREDGVVEAVETLVERGVTHINVNMGCPWGRMNAVLSGGGMFRAPEIVGPLLQELRAIVPGSLSVKTRAGLEDEREIFDVLEGFVEGGIDFLILHARTVAQKYRGEANHALTAELVERAPFPVIANGDVRDAATARRVLEHTQAAGLMLGRGAVSDPHLFARIRGQRGEKPHGRARTVELASHLRALLDVFEPIFHGDAQVLHKLKETLAHVDDDDQHKLVKALKKKKKVAHAREELDRALAG